MQLTTTRLSYLLYLNRMAEGETSVTRMARLYSVSKSTVSRNMDFFIEKGLVYPDSMRLTSYGKALTQSYAAEVELFGKWVEHTLKMDGKSAVENAMQMAVNLSPEMKAKLLKRIKLGELIRDVSEKSDFSFSSFSKHIENGEYPVSFVVFREEIKNGKYVSMADSGFEHPAVLTIKDGAGTVIMKSAVLERRNIMQKLIARGKLSELEYEDNGEFLRAVKNGDVYYFPADALSYTYHKEENLLIGNVRLQMYAPLRDRKVHIRRAILTVMIHEL